MPDLPAAPFPFEKPAETTREERNRLIAECHRLWRSESMDWAAVEAAMASDPLDIVDATLTRGEGRVLLTVGGFLDGARYDRVYCAVALAGESLSVRRSDGKPLDLEALVGLGAAYWSTIGQR